MAVGHERESIKRGLFKFYELDQKTKVFNSFGYEKWIFKEFYSFKETKKKLSNGCRYRGTIFAGKRNGVGKYFDTNGVGKWAISENGKIVKWLRSFDDLLFEYNDFKFCDCSCQEKVKFDNFENFMLKRMSGNLNNKILSKIKTKLKVTDPHLNYNHLIKKHCHSIFSQKLPSHFDQEI